MTPKRFTETVMAMAGQAALAMWWDIAPDRRVEFEHWHSHEHFPERLGLPGFRRASRWAAADGAEGFFVLYELDDHDVLSSPAYLARLNAPSPWSTRMMPHHRNMVRSQCRVAASRGGAIAGELLTLRLSPADGQATRLSAALDDWAAREFAEPGLAGVHRLRDDTPAIATTTEQRIRGGDRAADWIVLVVGYDAAVLDALAADTLRADRLQAIGAMPGAQAGRYRLRHAAIAADVAA